MNLVVATPFKTMPTSKHVWQVGKAVGWSLNPIQVASIDEAAGEVPDGMFANVIRHTNNEDRINAERTYYYAKEIAWPLAVLAAEVAGEDGMVLWLHENIVPNNAAPTMIATLKRRLNMAWVSAAPRFAPDGTVIDNASRCVIWRAAALLEWTADFTRDELLGFTTMDAVMHRMNNADQQENYLWLNDLKLNG